MAPDASRIAELRRRVHADPASIVFAQLADEYRGAGLHREAVECCRAGLAYHPGHVSARVTLGRSLIELGALDDAARELEIVLERAPATVTALLGLAEVHERRGNLDVALEHYRRALDVTRRGSHLGETGDRIDREILGAARAAAEQWRAPSTDFDALLTSLGAPDAAPPPLTEALLSNTPLPVSGVIPPLPTAPASADTLAKLEDDLRAFTRARDGAAEAAMVEELDTWLRVLAAERSQSSPL